MIEGNRNSENDDLSEFADYLAEFDSIISFDAEIVSCLWSEHI